MTDLPDPAARLLELLDELGTTGEMIERIDGGEPVYRLGIRLAIMSNVYDTDDENYAAAISAARTFADMGERITQLASHAAETLAAEYFGG